MITFVALLMFLQLGVGWGESALLCSLLTLPWVLKSFVRAKIRQIGSFSRQLKFLEVCICLLLVSLAFCFTDRHSNHWLLFANLFVLCFFCAAHELVARMYYEHMLRPRWQRFYNSWKMFVSQSTVVLTYGVMIVFVGYLEVFYHNRWNAIPLSWSMAVYVLAGCYLLLVIYNFFALKPPAFVERPRGSSHSPDEVRTFGSAVKAEIYVIDRISHKPHWFQVVIYLALLLLPQALLFHSRVLFFIASRSLGGLSVSLQWIGLVQGTVGVIAFSAGLGLGHWLLVRHNTSSPVARSGASSRPAPVVSSSAFLPARSSARIPLFLMILCLGFSPLVYLILSYQLPLTLLPLCVAAFLAQFFFGFGLNSTMPFIRYISGERYRSTINYLYIPLISFVMLPPIAASGWLADNLGFQQFFLLDSLLVPIAYLAAFLGLKKLTLL